MKEIKHPRAKRGLFFEEEDGENINLRSISKMAHGEFDRTKVTISRRKINGNWIISICPNYKIEDDDKWKDKIRLKIKAAKENKQ